MELLIIISVLVICSIFAKPIASVWDNEKDNEFRRVEG